MVSDSAVIIFSLYIVFIVGFIIKSVRDGNRELIHRLYYAMSLILVLWDAMLIAIRFTDPENTVLLRIFDAVM